MIVLKIPKFVSLAIRRQYPNIFLKQKLKTLFPIVWLFLLIAATVWRLKWMIFFSDYTGIKLKGIILKMYLFIKHFILIVQNYDLFCIFSENIMLLWLVFKITRFYPYKNYCNFPMRQFFFIACILKIRVSTLLFFLNLFFLHS